MVSVKLDWWRDGAGLSSDRGGATAHDRCCWRGSPGYSSARKFGYKEADAFWTAGHGIDAL